MREVKHSDDSSLADHQRQRLGRWLNEWELDQILRKELAKMTSKTRHTTSASVFPYAAAKPMKVGEIRLLHPAVGTSDERPVYFAILDKRPDNTFLIAPFGRFAEPALPGEWLTGLKAMPLRVLCLWNSRIVGGAALHASWCAGCMKTGKISQAIEVHSHIKVQMPLTSVSLEDLGPLVKHPLDPRLQYQIEEENLVDEVLPVVRQGRSSAVYETEDTELRLAAESQEPYGSEPRRTKEEDKASNIYISRNRSR